MQKKSYKNVYEGPKSKKKISYKTYLVINRQNINYFQIVIKNKFLITEYVQVEVRNFASKLF